MAAEQKAIEFEALPNRFGIKIRGGSDLEAALLSVFEILERRRLAVAADWTTEIQ